MSHALFPPSGAERWLRCAYSVQMSKLFKSTDTAASINGTKHHAIAALHLEQNTESKIKGMPVYLNAVRGAAEGNTLFVERKVIIVPDLCWGTSDAIVVAPNFINIFDLKWGKSAVHATDNPQEKLYGIGTLNEFPMPMSAPMRLSIVQPNVASGWPVKDWDTTVGHVIKFKDKVHAAIDAALGPNPKAVAGSHCYWCPAKLHCQAYLKSKK